MKLNEKIVWYRRYKKLSQEELAAQVGVSRQAVSKWELSEASPDTGKLLALAAALGVTTDHLLNDAEEPGREAPPFPPRESAPDTPPPGPDQFSNLPGFLGKMVRRWGWLAGIYLALEGGGLTLFGILGRLMFSAAFRGMDRMAGGSGTPFFNRSPVFGVPDGFTIVVDGQTIQTGSSSLSGVQAVMLAIPTLALVIGLAMIAGGLALAYVLWKKGRKGE